MRRLAGETGADRVKTVYGLSHNRHVVNGRAGFSANKKGAAEGAFLLISVFYGSPCNRQLQKCRADFGGLH